MLRTLLTQQTPANMPGKIVYGPGNASRDREPRRLLLAPVAAAASFALFGLGGLCLRLLVFPLLGCLPGDADNIAAARHTVSRLFWFFVRFMARAGVLTYDIKARNTSGARAR
jgi:hypothetical protein